MGDELPRKTWPQRYGKLLRCVSLLLQINDKQGANGTEWSSDATNFTLMNSPKILTYMQTIGKSSDIKVGKISDFTVKPGKIIDIGKFKLACGSQFIGSLKDVKTNPVSAVVALVPHRDSKFNTSALPDTTVDFKAVDDAVEAMVDDWNITIPAKTVAYATFSKVVFLGNQRDAILFITTDKSNNRLYLKSPGGEHVWFSDAKVVYCKKSKLFVLDGDGYSMFVDLGL